MTPEVQYGIVATLSVMIFVVGVVVIGVMLRDLKNRVSSVGTSSRPALIQIAPKDNPGLLLAAMRTFEGTGHISFEGVDPDSALRDLVGATHVPTRALRSASLFGSSANFVVMPLTSENIDAISKLINWTPDTDWDPNGRMDTDSFFHVQIAVEDHCVFGAWDNFDEECVIATDEFPLEVLDRLVAEGTIRSYTIDTYPYRGRYWHGP